MAAGSAVRLPEAGHQKWFSVDFMSVSRSCCLDGAFVQFPGTPPVGRGPTIGTCSLGLP